jgi:hypothetical protein
MPSGNILNITQTTLDSDVIKSEKQVKSEELKQLLASSTKAPKKKNKKKAADEATEEKAETS